MAMMFLLHTWRERWRSLVVLAVMIGLAGGLAFASIAGARRSASSLDRFRDEAHVLDLFVAGGFDGGLGGEPEAFLRLLDGPLVAESNDVAFVFADESHGFVFARTSERGGDVERGVLLDGRYPDPDEPLEVALGEVSADKAGVEVGDTLEVATFTQAQGEVLFETGDLGQPEGPVLELAVVGLVRNGFDIAASDADSGVLILTPAFLREFGDGQVGLGAPSHLVRLREGAAGVSEFTDAVTESYGDEHLPSVNVGQREQAVRDAITVITTALVALTLVIVLAGITWVWSLLARHQRVVAPDVEVLGALGATPSERRRLLIAAALPAVVGGTVLAPALAISLSPRLPVGSARRFDPDPGFHVDGPVLALGVVVLVTALGLALALSAARVVARSGRGAAQMGVRVPRLAESVARALKPAPGTGVRFALHAPPGTSAPVRPALLGACVAVVGLVAVAVVGANLQRLVDTPARWGTPWDVTIGSVNPDVASSVSDEDRAMLRVNDDIDAAAVVLFDEQVTIEGLGVLALTFEGVRGELAPTVIEGREPRSPDEVAVGADTLNELGASIGSTVSVASRSQRRADFRIVGVLAMPAIGDPGPLGVGAGFTSAGGDLLKLGDNSESDDAGNFYMAIRWRDGVDHDAALARLGERGANHVFPVKPPEMHGLDDVQRFPLLAASALVVLGVIATTHALVVTVRRRRLELGVLSSLGFAPAHRRRVILVQATTIALVALMVGVPLGAVVGRLVWSAMASALGVADDVTFPLGVLAVGAVGLVVTVNLIAAWPAHQAGRLRVADALRSE